MRAELLLWTLLLSMCFACSMSRGTSWEDELETGEIDEDRWSRWKRWDPVHMFDERSDALSNLSLLFIVQLQTTDQSRHQFALRGLDLEVRPRERADESHQEQALLPAEFPKRRRCLH